MSRSSPATPRSYTKGDLDEIAVRGSLRVLTRNNATSYFLHKGTQQGFDYELMKLFAAEHGLRLDIVVPPESDDLVPWLLEGKGDVIAAQMTVTAGSAGADRVLHAVPVRGRGGGPEGRRDPLASPLT